MIADACVHRLTRASDLLIAAQVVPTGTDTKESPLRRIAGCCIFHTHRIEQERKAKGILCANPKSLPKFLSLNMFRSDAGLFFSSNFRVSLYI